MASEKVKTFTDANFGDEVKNGVVLVDFWATWCAPCRMMAPEFEKAAALLEPNVRLAKVDTEQAQRLAQRFDIRSIPTLAMFRGGREVARQAGAMNAAQIAAWVKANS